MKKKVIALMLMTSLVFVAYGCGSTNAEKTTDAVSMSNETESLGDETEDISSETESLQETESTVDEAESQTETNTVNENSELSFSDLENLQFCFSSGAGGWATLLSIDANGSFTGEYYDGEMGEMGDDYPNGTTYQSNFSGQFSQPVQINEYTYSMQILELNYEQEIGTEEIIDGMRYCYSEVYGLEGTDEILIYVPGAPLKELPEELRSWIGYNDLSDTTDTELPFYALYNEAQEYGFSSY